MAEESEKERRDREKRERKEQDERDRQAIEEGNRKHNERRRENAINAAAEQEALERLDDEFLDREFLTLFDMDARAAADYLSAAHRGETPPEELAEAIKAVKDAAKAMEGGIIFGPDKGKARRILRKNKDKIKKGIEAGKKKKSWWSCSVLAVPLVGGLAAMLWAAYEGVSAVATALF